MMKANTIPIVSPTFLWNTCFPFPLQVVQFKQQSRLEEKRKKALDLQLDFIVGQTERYSDLLSQSLSEANVATPPKATPLTSPDAEGSGPKGQQQHQDEDGEYATGPLTDL